jgi:hypothetical protein
VGPQAEVTFLKSFGGDGFRIAERECQDIRRWLGSTAAARRSRE